MYKLKALKTFQDKHKKLIPAGKVFKTDDHYAKLLIKFKVVEVIAIIQEKAKVIYEKKIIEPEKNKEEMEEIKVELGEVGILVETEGKKKAKKIEPITTDQFRTKKRKYGKRSKW